MATITESAAGDQNILLNKVTWGPMANGDVGRAFHASEFADRSVQIKGTLGTGGTVTMQGSNDGGTTWGTLNDAFGNALTLNAVGQIKQLTELAEYVRPSITAGDGTTAITVILFMRKLPD